MMALNPITYYPERFEAVNDDDEEEGSDGGGDGDGGGRSGLLFAADAAALSSNFLDVETRTSIALATFFHDAVSDVPKNPSNSDGDEAIVSNEEASAQIFGESAYEIAAPPRDRRQRPQQQEQKQEGDAAAAGPQRRPTRGCFRRCYRNCNFHCQFNRRCHRRPQPGGSRQRHFFLVAAAFVSRCLLSSCRRCRRRGGRRAGGCDGAAASSAWRSCRALVVASSISTTLFRFISFILKLSMPKEQSQTPSTIYHREYRARKKEEKKAALLSTPLSSHRRCYCSGSCWRVVLFENLCSYTCTLICTVLRAASCWYAPVLYWCFFVFFFCLQYNSTVLVSSATVLFLPVSRSKIR